MCASKALRCRSLSFFLRTRRFESQMESWSRTRARRETHPRSHSRVSDVRTCVHTSCTRRMLNEPVSRASRCRCFSRQPAGRFRFSGRERSDVPAPPRYATSTGKILISIGELIWCLVGNCARGIVTVFNSIIGCLLSFHARIRIP